jgi:hypothetical protein
VQVWEETPPPSSSPPTDHRAKRKARQHNHRSIAPHGPSTGRLHATIATDPRMAMAGTVVPFISRENHRSVLFPSNSDNHFINIRGRLYKMATEDPPVGLHSLPEDLLVKILSSCDADVLSFACSSKEARRLSGSEQLWRLLSLAKWPHLANVLRAFDDEKEEEAQGESSLGHGRVGFGPIQLPPHLMRHPSSSPEAWAWRALYLGRHGCRTQRHVYCDAAIELLQKMDEPKRPPAAVIDDAASPAASFLQLGAILRAVDPPSTLASATEGRSWLWLLGHRLVQTQFVEELVTFARGVGANLDEWYERVEAGEHVDDSEGAHSFLLLRALRGRTALEEILATMRLFVADAHHSMPDRVGEAPTGGRGSSSAGGGAAPEQELSPWEARVRQLATLAKGLNRNILSLREEGCDMSVPACYRPPATRRDRDWWWYLEPPMMVSGGNPFIPPLPAWVDAELAGGTSSQ